VDLRTTVPSKGSRELRRRTIKQKKSKKGADSLSLEGGKAEKRVEKEGPADGPGKGVFQ